MLGFSGGAPGLEFGEGGGADRFWEEFGCGLAGPGLDGRDGAVAALLPYEVGLGGAREESDSSW